MTLKSSIAAAVAIVVALTVFARPSAPVDAQTETAPRYEAFAVRFGVLPAFRVSGLVAGADAARTLDIPVMVWLLKGNNGRNVLVDSGFYRQKFVDRWKVRDFRSPADAVAAAGVAPENITDIIISIVLTAFSTMTACVGCFVTLPVWIIVAVVHIVCMVKGVNGERFLIPGLSDFADKF